MFITYSTYNLRKSIPIKSLHANNLISDRFHSSIELENKKQKTKMIKGWKSREKQERIQDGRKLDYYIASWWN